MQEFTSPPITARTIEKFWSRVTDRPADGCWEWPSMEQRGYGAIYIGGDRSVRGMYAATRVSWVIHYGPIPDNLLVCHHCDNARCVRPDHLYLGDRRQNLRDAIDRGLVDYASVREKNKGEGNPAARLSEQEVLAMRRLAAQGVKHYVIADRFGVSRGHASHVIRGRVWRHLPLGGQIQVPVQGHLQLGGLHRSYSGSKD